MFRCAHSAVLKIRRSVSIISSATNLLRDLAQLALLLSGRFLASVLFILEKKHLFPVQIHVHSSGALHVYKKLVVLSLLQDWSKCSVW